MDQAKLNADYQEILNKIFGGKISLRDKYLNPNAVINHHCKVCMKNFYSRPLWLVNKQQLHECYFAATESSKEKQSKTIAKKQANSTPSKVTEAMKLEMIQLYRQGDSLKAIAKRFGITSPTVKRYIKNDI